MSGRDIRSSSIFSMLLLHQYYESCVKNFIKPCKLLLFFLYRALEIGKQLEIGKG